jgi:hypothetical protein
MIKRLLTVTALAFAALPGVAHACVQPATSQPFAQFGDKADYWLAPGGSFEPGGPAWTLNHAAVVNDNERFFVNARSDTHALTLEPGGQAVSPAFCADASNPTLRLFARKTGGAGTLKVELLFTNVDGRYSERVAGFSTQTGVAGWTPTPALKLATAMPAGQLAKGDMSVQLRFTAGPDAGAWTIDDVYVDPYKFD